MIDIVFFDAGQTILYPHPSFPELFAQTCNRQGASVEVEQFEDVQARFENYLRRGTSESGVEYTSLSDEGSRAFWMDLYRALLRGLGLDEEIASELYKVFSDSRSYKLYPDTIPAIERLQRDGYRIGLISNFEGWLEKMLVELEVGHVFDVSVISGLEGVEKPDPRIYEIALERAGVHPRSAVHVGDSVTFDVEPARRTGMLTVLIDRGERYADEAAACPTIASLEELPDLVKTL